MVTKPQRKQRLTENPRIYRDVPLPVRGPEWWTGNLKLVVMEINFIKLIKKLTMVITEKTKK